MSIESKIQKYALTGCNWELTLGCTLKCIHCGSQAGRARSAELSLEECLSIAGDLVKMGINNLTMIGGEVFLFKGWERLAAFLTNHGVDVNIITNGYLFGEREIHLIQEAGLVNVGVSLDGMDLHHNRIRGRKDAFERLVKALDLMAENGIGTGVVTTLMQDNVGDIEEMYPFLIDHQVQVWQLQLASPMGNLIGRDDVTLSRKQVKKVIEFIREKGSQRRIEVVAADSVGYYDENETYIRGHSQPIGFFGGCSAGLTNLFIDSVGNVKGCGALYSDEFIEGNLRQRSLVDIWNDPHAFAYNRKFNVSQLEGGCKGCDMAEHCRGGCRSSNYFSTGSLFSNAYCVKYL